LELQLKCELNGLASLKLDATTRLNVKVRFPNGDVHENIWVDRKEEVDVPGSKGTVYKDVVKILCPNLSIPSFHR